MLRPENDTHLIEVFSEDTVDELIQQYNLKRKKLIGRHISDIASVFREITNWSSVDIVDLTIPFHYGHQSREPRGYRIWYLSRTQHDTYYNGCFFDLKVSETNKRQIIQMCKLSSAAIQLFNQCENISRNEPCKLN